MLTSGSGRNTVSRWRFSRSSRLALGLYFTATVFYALARIRSTARCRSCVLFQVGFLYTGLMSVVQQYAGDPVVLSTQVASGK